MNECATNKPKTGKMVSLALHHVAGVFIILTGGIVASLVLLAMEKKCTRFMNFVMV